MINKKVHGAGSHGGNPVLSVGLGMKVNGSRGNRWSGEVNLQKMTGKHVMESRLGSEHKKSKARADPKSKSARTQKKVRTGRSTITKTKTIRCGEPTSRHARFPSSQH